MGGEMFKPKIFTVMKDYSKAQFMADAMAGAIVTVLAVPLSIAFAVSMGVPPEMGLYVSIIASFIVAILGGTYVQVGGPSVVFIVVVTGIMHQYGIEGVMISTFLAGLILLLLGILRLGTMIKYLPYPITIGFMSGTAVVVFTTQVQGFLGLQLEDVPANFIGRWTTYLSSLNQSDLLTVFVGMLALAILIFWPKVTKKIPSALVALVATTLVVRVLGLPVRTIGSQFTDLALSLPRIELPRLSLETILYFFPTGLTIAFLCIVMSLLTAVAADNLTGKKHCSNTELIAQGVVNVILGMWGMIPAAGVATRTMANVENGARTPIATLTHSILLLTGLVFLLPLIRLIPMVTLAAMLIMAAYGMSEWRVFLRLLKAPKGDLLVLLATFLITIAFELSIAVVIGILLSAIVFMKRMSEQMHVDDNCPLAKQLPKAVSVFDVSGPLFFGDTDRFFDAIALHDDLKVVIIRLRVGMIDTTAMHTLSLLHDKCKSHQIRLILSETLDGPYHILKKIGMIKQLGKENIFRDFEDAVRAATENL